MTEEYNISENTPTSPLQEYLSGEIRFARDLINALRTITDGKSKLTEMDIVIARQEASIKRRNRVVQQENLLD